jgi:hypothetical protein
MAIGTAYLVLGYLIMFLELLCILEGTFQKHRLKSLSIMVEMVTPWRLVGKRVGARVSIAIGGLAC